MSKTLIEFWSDIENVESADSGDIQRDILAYLHEIERLNKELEKIKRRERFDHEKRMDIQRK